jgi:hypothetical protein
MNRGTVAGTLATILLTGLLLTSSVDEPVHSPPPLPRPSATSEDSGSNSSLWAIPRHGGAVADEADPQAWTPMLNPEYGYGCQIPASWRMSCPDELNRGRGRVLWPPGEPEVRVVLFAFGIYDLPVDEEIDAAETIWLLEDPRIRQMSLLARSNLKVGSSPARRLKRRFVFKDRPEVFQSVTTFVEARPKSYALALLGPESRLPRYLAEYEHMVRTFVYWDLEETPFPGPTALPSS